MSKLNAAIQLGADKLRVMSYRKTHISRLLTLRRILSICLVLIIAFYCNSGQVAAADKIIRVGVYQNKPKIFIDEEGKPSGLFIELLEQIAAQEGWTLTFISGEWETCLQALEAGEIDLMPDMAHTPTRDQKFDFNQIPVVVSWSRVYTTRLTPIRQLSDLNDKRIAVLRGSIQEEVFTQALSELGYDVILIPVNSFEEAFALTAKNSADAVVTNHFFGDSFYRKYHLKKTNINFNRVELFYATAKGKNSELLEAIDRNLAEWINEPDSPFYQAAERWTEKPFTITKFAMWVTFAIVGLLLLLLGIICLLRFQVRTRSKHLEETNLALRQSKERYRLISEIISDFAYAYRVEPDNTFIREWIIGGFQQITGYSSQEIDEHGGLFSLIFPDDISISQAHVSRLLAERDDVGEFRIVRKNGEIRWLCNHAHPIWDEKLQRVMQIYGAAQDVTERKRAEEALKESEEKFRSLTEHLPNMIFINKQGRVVYVNKRCEEIMGYTREEFYSEAFDFVAVTIPEYIERVKTNFARHMRGEEVEPFDYALITKDGKRIMAILATKLIDYGGEKAILGIITDITERKRAEEAVHKGYKELTAVYETSQRLQQLLPPDQLAQKILEILENSLDCTYSEVLLIDEKSGRLEPFALSDQNKVAELVETDEEYPDLKNLPPGAGITGWAAEHGESVRVGDVEKDQRYLKIHPDVRSELCVPLQIQNRVIGVVNIESNKVDVYTEDDQRMLESIAAQISVALQNMQLLDEVQKNAVLLKERIAELKLAQKELRRSHEQYERFYMQDLTGDFTATPDGKLIDCNPAFLNIFGFSSKEEALHTNVITLFHSPEERQKLISRLQRERNVEYYEIEMKKRDGSPLYIIANILGRFDKQDKLMEIHGYLFDDTKRKIAEEQLRQSQKFESLGALASGIAHDFNNILAIIMGHASLIKLIKDASPKLAHHMDAIFKATSRGAALVNQMLTFARKTGAIQEPLDLNLLVKDMSKMIYETFPKVITFKMNLEHNLPFIIADITQINQVLMNLCLNARDAMPDGGTLTVNTSIIDGKKISLKFPKTLPQDYVLLSIADTGTGMDRQTRERIFEPFFTTKMSGKGTGLGLAVVHGIVTAHGGFIDLESKPGKGTIFYIYLPAQEQLPEVINQKQQSQQDIQRGTETILVVEDEEMLRGFIHQLLEKNGYTVLSAENGEQAIEIYQHQKQQIALIIMDLGLPMLSGDEVFRRIKSINSTADVIIASGYIDPNIKTELSQAGVRAFIQKPYSPIEILKKIREVVDSKE